MNNVPKYLKRASLLLLVAIVHLLAAPLWSRADDVSAPPAGAPDSGLSFYLPFDGGFKSPIGKERVPTKVGDYDFVPGKVGQALREGAQGSYLLYRADGNLSGDEGTVSLWVRPQWDLASSSFHTFWNMTANGRFVLYRPGATKDLAFLYFGKGQSYAKHSLLTASIADWQPGQWHHIAATWRAGEIRLYVDGQLKREVVDANLILPEVGPSSVFFVGDSYDAHYGIQRGYSGVADTDLDEFRLYTTALDATAIRALAGKSPTSEALPPPMPPLVVVPKTTHPPIIDGNFSFDKWKDAAGFTGFVDLGTGKLTDRQTAVLLTYDDTNLYIATFAQVPPGGPLKAAVDRRDGPVYSDDSIEVYLDPAHAGQPGHIFQFVGNSIGTFLDLKDGDPAWNGAWNYKSAIQNNWRGFGQTFWVTELSVPFASLGRGTPADGEQWTANFARSWYTGQQNFTSWAPTGKTAYNVPERFGVLQFAEPAPAFQWTTLRDLASGQPSIEGTALNTPLGTTPLQLNASATAAGQTFFSGQLKTESQTPQIWTEPIDLASDSHDNLQIEAKAGAQLLYRAQIPYQVETGVMRVLLSPVPSRDLLVVDVDPLRYCTHWRPGWSIKLRLAAGDRSFGESLITRYTPPLARAQFSLRDVPVGNYQLQVAIVDAAGKTVASQDEPFTKPLPPIWLNNKIGITDKVLKPWTPIVIDRGSLKTWGRSYDFGDNAFPQQVTSAAEPLLQGPARLLIDGRPLPAGSARYDSQSGAKVVRSGTAQSGAWRVHWTCTAEYDGFLWYEITLDPGAARPATLKSLALELPLRAETSKLYTASNGSYALGGGECGATPALWNSAWKQVFWLGNERAGLCWFAESDEHWNLKDRHDALRFERSAAGTLATVRFVTQPLAVTGPVTYRFGLQATPTRPTPLGWRGWQWDSGHEKYMQPGSTEHPTHATNWAHFNYAMSPFDAKPGTAEFVAANHKLGIKVIPYEALLGLNEKAPDFDYFKAEWLNQPRMDAGAGAGQQAWFVNVKGSFQDYFLYALREKLRHEKWDGVYFDFDQGAVPDMNEFHGSGYLDASGVRHPTYDILAQREFHKRLWAMLQQELGVDEPIVMVHMSGCVVPPVHSFANVYFDGEQFLFSPKVDDDYTKVVSRDQFRAEFVTSHFGGAAVLLPELNALQLHWLYAKTEPDKIAARQRFDAAIDTMLLYTLSHGTDFVPVWMDMEYLQPLLDAKRDFDLGSTRFRGYWENQKLVSLAPANPNVLASVYAHHDRLWLEVGNWTDQPQTVTARLDLAKLCPDLKLATAVSKNVWKDGPVIRDGDGWRFTVGPKAARLIEIDNR